MKRRKFLVLSAGLLGVSQLTLAEEKAKPAAGKEAKGKDGITEKDLFQEGKPGAVANYCEHPEKQPNKFCPTKPGGVCADCMFYNKDNSKTTFKGKEVAKCQLLAAAPSYVYSTAACATWVKKT